MPRPVRVGNECRPPGYVRRSGFTIAYQYPCSLSETAWWIWFGLGGHYHSLPCLRSGSRPAACGLYQPLPPRRGTRYTLTYSTYSHKHRAPSGWVAQGYNCIERWCTVENTQGESERWHTVVVGIRKKKSFSSGRSACFFEPMVVKLVGQ